MEMRLSRFVFQQTELCHHQKIKTNLSNRVKKYYVIQHLKLFVSAQERNQFSFHVKWKILHYLKPIPEVKMPKTHLKLSISRLEMKTMNHHIFWIWMLWKMNFMTAFLDFCRKEELMMSL